PSTPLKITDSQHTLRIEPSAQPIQVQGAIIPPKIDASVDGKVQVAADLTQPLKLDAELKPVQMLAPSEAIRVKVDPLEVNFRGSPQPISLLAQSENSPKLSFGDSTPLARDPLPTQPSGQPGQSNTDYYLVLEVLVIGVAGLLGGLFN